MRMRRDNEDKKRQWEREEITRMRRDNENEKR